jgi:hypothetical protein
MMSIPALTEISTTSTEKVLPNRKPIKYGKLSSSDYFPDPIFCDDCNFLATTENSSTLQKNDYIQYFKSMGVKIKNENQISVLLNKNKKLRRSLIEISEDLSLNPRYELSIQLLDDNVIDYDLQEIEVGIHSKELTDDFFDEVYTLPEKYFEQINASNFRIIISCGI